MMALKNEPQFQMYLDVLDIVEKNGYTVKTEKDSGSMKVSAVFRNSKPCGRVLVSSLPPENRESTGYANSAHAKLAEEKESVRAEAPEGLVEGVQTDSDGCLWYYGFTLPQWVELVDDEFERWLKASPMYQKAVAEAEKLKKQKPETGEEFALLEADFKQIAAEFTAISFYRDSPEMAGDCLRHVTELKEKIYQKAAKMLKKLDKDAHAATSGELAKLIAAYDEVLKKFRAIKDFDDSAEKMAFCVSQIAKFEAFWAATAYKEALRDVTALESREETGKFFNNLSRWRKYRKLAKKFNSTIPYDESAERAKKCRQLFRAYRWKVLKILVPVLMAVAAVVTLVLLVYSHFFTQVS